MSIGNGISSIAESVFNRCTSLTSIVIPDTVTRIGDEAFTFCSALTSVTIPSSVMSIGYSSFKSCVSLTNATFAGDAPVYESDYPFSHEESVFLNTHANFKVYFFESASGFTTPTWLGYASEMLLIPTRVLALSGDFNFASGAAGQNVTRTLTLTNTGNSPLSIYSITYPYAFSGDWERGVIAAGASQAITVTFAPTVAVAFLEAIQISSNATSGDSSVAITIQTDDPDPTNPLPRPLRDAISYGNNYYLSDWFGGFFAGDIPGYTWVYSMDFGWAWISPDGTPQNMWWWCINMDSWLWGSQGDGRSFHRNKDDVWILALSNVGEEGGSWIYNSKTEEWSYLAP